MEKDNKTVNVFGWAIKVVLIVFCMTTANMGLAQNCSTYDTVSVSTCNIYIAPSGSQHVITSYFNDTIQNAAGCDSIITIDLEMFYDATTFLEVRTCGEPYVSDDGNTYPTTGTYIENYLTINNCDSTVFIDVQIGLPHDIWSTVFACDEYISDAGIVYTVTGAYNEVFSDQFGCDSVIQYSITIDTIDTTALWVSPMIIEATAEDASYQWIDCNNSNAIILGANEKVFTATSNGDYACIVTKGGCTKTTNCVRVQSLGLSEADKRFDMYPNPSKGQFTISLFSITNNAKLEIRNVAGQLIYQTNLLNIKTDINISHFEAGVYFLTVSNNSVSTKRTIVIQ